MKVTQANTIRAHHTRHWIVNGNYCRSHRHFRYTNSYNPVWQRHNSIGRKVTRVLRHTHTTIRNLVSLVSQNFSLFCLVRVLVAKAVQGGNRWNILPLNSYWLKSINSKYGEACLKPQPKGVWRSDASLLWSLSKGWMHSCGDIFEWCFTTMLSPGKSFQPHIPSVCLCGEE